MPKFKLRPEGFAAVKKKIVLRFTVILVLAMVLVVVVDQNGAGRYGRNANDWFFTGLVVAILGSLAIWRALKYQLVLYTSYTIAIENNSITRLQQNTPAITIFFSEVTGITKSTDGTLTVKGTKPGDIIYIPPTVENKADIELLLKKIAPIGQRVPLVQRYSLLVTVAFFTLMACLYIVNNKAVVGISGTVVSAVLAWGMYHLQSSRNFDARLKRTTLSLLRFCPFVEITICIPLL